MDSNQIMQNNKNQWIVLSRVLKTVIYIYIEQIQDAR